MYKSNTSLSRPPSSTANAAIAAFAGAAAGASIFYVFSRVHLRRTSALHEKRASRLDESRLAERRGRIRAEVKIRTLLKKRDEEQAAFVIKGEVQGEGVGGVLNRDGATSKTEEIPSRRQQPHNLLLRCIGTVVSPYTKRMGTPRQGALVPSGKGYVQLRVPVECVEGLEQYTHAWILFTFHANTDTPAMILNAGGDAGGGTTIRLAKTKIRPPRGNGIKVGTLATRSPHRPNNVGLSLVKIVGVDKKAKRLHVAGLDLVNGSPVYDIKPCVPWDIPGRFDGVPLSVPSWVDGDPDDENDGLRSVEFLSSAMDALETHVRYGRLAPLYARDKKIDPDGADATRDAANAIREVLAQDPRASNSNGPNKRGSRRAAAGESKKKNGESREGEGGASACAIGRSNTYRFVFCSVQVEFYVDGRGVGIVESVTAADLEEVEYIDGIPVLFET